MPNSRAVGSRIAVLIGGLLAVTLLSGSHCGNEITAPVVTPTPAFSPTPTPAPASVDAFVYEFGVVGGFQDHGVDSAHVEVKEGANTSTCLTGLDGHCTVSGLVVGPATVDAQRGDQVTHVGVSLVPGVNEVRLKLD